MFLGPLFWAYEFNRLEIIDLLINRGVDRNAKDANGKLASEMEQSKMDVNFKPGIFECNC